MIDHLGSPHATVPVILPRNVVPPIAGKIHEDFGPLQDGQARVHRQNYAESGDGFGCDSALDVVREQGAQSLSPTSRI